METATAISGLNFFGLARASVLQGQQFIDFGLFCLSSTGLEIMLSFQVGVIGPGGDKLEQTHFRIFYAITLLTVKDSGGTWGEFLIFSQTFCSLID